MAWLRLDDGFPDHPKVLELSEAKRWRWVRLLCYCARFETDGVVRPTVLRRLGLQASELVALGLLDQDGDELRVHDFLEYNPSREDLERERERWRRSKRSSRSRSNVHAGHSRDSTESPARFPASPSPMDIYNTPTSTVDAHAAPSADDGGLAASVGSELLTARVLSALGEIDEGRADYLRGALARLPDSVAVGILERLDGGGGAVRDPVGYVLGAVSRELRERGLA